MISSTCFHPYKESFDPSGKPLLPFVEKLFCHFECCSLIHQTKISATRCIHLKSIQLLSDKNTEAKSTSPRCRPAAGDCIEKLLFYLSTCCVHWHEQCFLIVSNKLTVFMISGLIECAYVTCGLHLMSRVEKNMIISKCCKKYFCVVEFLHFVLHLNTETDSRTACRMPSSSHF